LVGAPLISGGASKSRAKAGAGADWAAREAQLKALPPDELRAILVALKVPLPKAKLLVKTLLEAERALAPGEEDEEEDIDALLEKFSLEDRLRVVAANSLRKGVRAKQDDVGRFKEQPEGGGAAGGGGGGGAFGDGSSSGPLNAKKKEKKKKKKKR